MKYPYKTLFTLSAIIAATAVPFDVTLDAASAGAAFQAPALDFTSVAKKAIPCVVSIKVKGSSTTTRTSLFDSDDSDDMFSDPFFKRFFGGVPKQQRVPDTSPAQSQGSGFIITEDGQIVTNQHVIRDSSEIIVVLNDGREFTAKVVGQDPNTDVALLKIDAKGLPFLKLVNSDDLEVGQWVAAIGNPLGLQATLTVGVVSAKGRNNLDIENIEDFIQTDAPVNRGNSGGPLLNLDGDVVGMTTAIATSNSLGGYMGISFAIPSNLVEHVREQILTTGSVSRGYIGITMQAIDNDLAQAFGLNKTDGALVSEVVAGSPGAQAGLKQGDIILTLNNNPVKSIATLRNTVALIKPDSTVNLGVLRDGKMVNLPVKIGNFPTATAAVEVTHVSGKYGFAVENLTAELAKKYGYQEEKGVVISKVEQGSPAAWAGIRPGALILAINKTAVNSLEEYNKLLGNADKNAPTLFLIKQGGAVRFLSLKIN